MGYYPRLRSENKRDSSMFTNVVDFHSESLNEKKDIQAVSHLNMYIMQSDYKYEQVFNCVCVWLNMRFQT